MIHGGVNMFDIGYLPQLGAVVGVDLQLWNVWETLVNQELARRTRTMVGPTSTTPNVGGQSSDVSMGQEQGRSTSSSRAGDHHDDGDTSMAGESQSQSELFGDSMSVSSAPTPGLNIIYHWPSDVARESGDGGRRPFDTPENFLQQLPEMLKSNSPAGILASLSNDQVTSLSCSELVKQQTKMMHCKND